MARIKDKVDAAELKKMRARELLSDVLQEVAQVMEAYRIDVKWQGDSLEISYYQKDLVPSVTDSTPPEEGDGDSD